MNEKPAASTNKNFWKCIMFDVLLMSRISYVLHLHMIKNNVSITEILSFFSKLCIAPEFVLPIHLNSYFKYYVDFYPFGIDEPWACFRIDSPHYLRFDDSGAFIGEVEEETDENTLSLILQFEEAVTNRQFAMQETVHGCSHYACMLNTTYFKDFKNLLFIYVIRWFALFFGSMPLLCNLLHKSETYFIDYQKRILQKLK